MALSELITQLQSQGVKTSLRTNYKKYYKKYPHVVRLSMYSWHSNTHLRFDVTWSLFNQYCKTVKESLQDIDFTSRMEHFQISIFCFDVETVLARIPSDMLAQFTNIEIFQMDDSVQEETSEKVDLPKAVTAVVKQLPYEKYRYKIFWSNTRNTFQTIGREGMQAIVHQINHNPDTLPLDQANSDRLGNLNHRGTSYFYTNSTDLLCIISLISPRFIRRIEKFKTLEEVNEKATSRSVNQ